MNFEMTNKELAEAIVAIHAIFMVPEQAVLCIEYSNHLKALLEIQRIRAEMVTVDRLNIPIEGWLVISMLRKGERNAEEFANKD